MYSIATCHFLDVSEFNKIMKKNKTKQNNSDKYKNYSMKIKGVSEMVVQRRTQTRLVLENDIYTR